MEPGTPGGVVLREPAPAAKKSCGPAGSRSFTSTLPGAKAASSKGEAALNASRFSSRSNWQGKGRFRVRFLGRLADIGRSASPEGQGGGLSLRRGESVADSNVGGNVWVDGPARKGGKEFGWRAVQPAIDSRPTSAANTQSPPGTPTRHHFSRQSKSPASLRTASSPPPIQGLS